jgi:hypothetical protein
MADDFNALYIAFNALYIACADYYHTANDGGLLDDRVRAVYDAAARILNGPVADDIPDLWQLRAAYIDAHAALIGDHNSDHNFHAHAAALRAATTGHTMT